MSWYFLSIKKPTCTAQPIYPIHRANYQGTRDYSDIMYRKSIITMFHSLQPCYWKNSISHKMESICSNFCLQRLCFYLFDPEFSFENNLLFCYSPVLPFLKECFLSTLKSTCAAQPIYPLYMANYQGIRDYFDIMIRKSIITMFHYNLLTMMHITYFALFFCFCLICR